MLGGRVTQRMLTETTLTGLQTTLSRNQRLQEQLSSGKLVTRPSDDPAAATSAMRLRSQQRLDSQYVLNIDDAGGRLATADNALQGISELVIKAKQLLVNAQNAALPPASRNAISAELEVIQKGIVDAYNTRWLGRPVFGGTVVGSVAIDESGGYVGNDQPVLARIARDVAIRTDVSGTAAGASVLPDLLTRAAANVALGSEDMAADQDELDAVLGTILNTLGDVGARANQIDGTKQRVEGEQLDLRARISQNEDVDLPKAILDLQSSQVAYQAALGAAGKILQTSLMDYLR
jgi:flagellar hook-associated protein 3 FlgL